MKKLNVLNKLIICCLFPITVNAGSLENLERERAIFLDNFFSGETRYGEKHSQMQSSILRLIDLEKMVLRDKQLQGRNTPHVRKAFENYDLTFLVHASAEKKKLIIDQWLEQFQLTTESIMSARLGRR